MHTRLRFVQQQLIWVDGDVAKAGERRNLNRLVAYPHLRAALGDFEEARGGGSTNTNARAGRATPGSKFDRKARSVAGDDGHVDRAFEGGWNDSHSPGGTVA